MAKPCRNVSRQFGYAFGVAEITTHARHLDVDRLPEFVGAAELLSAILVGNRKDESPAISVAAAARIPVLVRDWAEPWILARQAAKRCVDRLLFRADEADLYLAAIGQGKDLRPQHGRVGDPHQLQDPLLFLASGDDEEPRAIRRGVDMRCLNLPINVLLVLR